MSFVWEWSLLCLGRVYVLVTVHDENSVLISTSPLFCRFENINKTSCSGPLARNSYKEWVYVLKLRFTLRHQCFRSASESYEIWGRKLIMFHGTLLAAFARMSQRSGNMWQIQNFRLWYCTNSPRSILLICAICIRYPFPIEQCRRIGPIDSGWVYKSLACSAPTGSS